MSTATMRIGPGLSRAAFIAVNVLALAVAYFALVEPTVAFFEGQRTAIEDRRELLSRYTRALERSGDEAGPNAAELFLPGGSEARRSAALQDIVKRISERSGTRILSVSGLASGREKAGAVGLRVDMVGPLRAMADTIAGIEAATPSLGIGRAAIRASAIKDDGPGDLTPLEAQLDIYGFSAP